jgi:hypothetical protein
MDMHIMLTIYIAADRTTCAIDTYAHRTTISEKKLEYDETNTNESEFFAFNGPDERKL